MNKWSKKEISLCKQVAKKYREDIEYGSWYIEPKTQKGVLLWDYEDTPYFVGDQCSDTVPLWTISDCLEFLRKKPGLHTLEIIADYHELEWTVVMNWKATHVGKTALEACLKVVLAVLEENVTSVTKMV